MEWLDCYVRRDGGIVGLPVVRPAVDEAFSCEFTHGGCTEFTYDCEYGRFVELDAQVTQVLHRAFDADLVGLFGCIVWKSTL